MLVKKVINFVELGYLNSSCIIRKSIILMVLRFSLRNKFMLLWQNTVTDVSIGLRPPSWYPSGWAMASPYKSLSQKVLGKKYLRIYILLKKNCCDLNLAYLPCFFSQILEFKGQMNQNVDSFSSAIFKPRNVKQNI